MAEIWERSATDVSRLIAAREVSAQEVMAAYLDRIEAVNPALNAIVSLRDRDDIMADARAADDQSPKGWLHGMPIAIKDLVETKGLRTTYGSPLFAEFVPEEDAAYVRRLKAAGAIVIGKTNTPEFGLGGHTYNPVFGHTANPYAPDRTCGGSSGGAGVALATQMLPVADGSDKMGSLRNPAGWNNVYSLRPTWGRVPEDPVGDTFLHCIATDGPMARSPEDILALMNTMAATDSRWPGAAWPALPDTIAPAAAGFKLGWLGDWGGAVPYEDGVLDLCQTALSDFSALGAAVDHLAPVFPASDLWAAWTTLRAFSIGVRRADFYRDPVKRDRLKAAAVYEIEQGLALTSEAIQNASVLRSKWLQSAVEAFETYDVLVLPTAQLFAFDKTLEWPTEIGGVPMDTYHRWMEVTVPASLLGLPVMTVPAGFSQAGLPMGLQLIGKPGDAARLIALAMAYHEATQWPDRRRPDLDMPVSAG